MTALFVWCRFQLTMKRAQLRIFSTLSNSLLKITLEIRSVFPSFKTLSDLKYFTVACNQILFGLKETLALKLIVFLTRKNSKKVFTVRRSYH